jgi:pyridoxine/pyridoxamine 5'-phosphate oxidase
MLQLNANGKYALTAYWPTLARQYRLQGGYQWIAASVVPAEYAARPWRAKVWDWLHEEMPQSEPGPKRDQLVTSFESRSAELARTFGGRQAVPPPSNAGMVRLEPLRVEVQQIDDERRLHDRRVLVRDRERWTQTILVP